ncbi:sugar phosphate isomerase/epimerase family protein [Acidisoma cladoniae]|uniref:sugar phosphate isomerase/epimerase family protein n=1 Tax=Acidisoma cladoniae TaxID=3040935 RepID=UPI0025502C7B|nr:sugar phosphate isomerase/epimerase [Acidisoma sp. PAMC 29798]
MQIGIFAKTFSGTSVEAILMAVREAGYAVSQFNLSCAGLASMPDAVSEKVLRKIRAATKASGVSLVALSGTYNMIHPDEAVRARGLRQLGVVIAAASHLGIPLVTLCTGTRDAEDQWRHHQNNADPSAWHDLVTEMAKALALAERFGVDLGIEPEPSNVVTSALDARRLIDDMASPRLRVVLDPANLFETATAEAAAALVRDAVERLGARIAMAHAKDRAAIGRLVPVGHGIVDFADFVARLRGVGFDGPLVAHGLSAEEAPAVARYLRAVTT